MRGYPAADVIVRPHHGRYLVAVRTCCGEIYKSMPENLATAERHRANLIDHGTVYDPPVSFVDGGPVAPASLVAAWVLLGVVVVLVLLL